MEHRCARLGALALAILLVVSSCAGSDQGAAEPSPAESATEPPATAATPPPATPPPATASPQATATTVPAEPSTAEPEIAEADLRNVNNMLAGMGVTDVDSTRTCIFEEAAADGLGVDDLVTGSGAPIFVAALRCDTDLAEQMIASAALFNTSGTDLTVDDVECIQRTSLEYFADTPLDESDRLFAADVPPDEFTDAVVSSCDVRREDALLVMIG